MSQCSKMKENPGSSNLFACIRFTSQSGGSHTQWEPKPDRHALSRWDCRKGLDCFGLSPARTIIRFRLTLFAGTFSWTHACCDDCNLWMDDPVVHVEPSARYSLNIHLWGCFCSKITYQCVSTRICFHETNHSRFIGRASLRLRPTFSSRAATLIRRRCLSILNPTCYCECSCILCFFSRVPFFFGCARPRCPHLNVRHGV